MVTLVSLAGLFGKPADATKRPFKGDHTTSKAA
jgi:hypothetical protein